MPDKFQDLSKGELREELARREGTARRRSLAARIQSDAAAEATGFGFAAVGYGYLEERGTIPAQVMNLDTELVGGAALFVMSRGRTGRRAAMMRGASYALLAGALKDMGRKVYRDTQG